MNRSSIFFVISLAIYSICFLVFAFFIVPNEKNQVFANTQDSAIIVLTGGSNRIIEGVNLLIEGKGKKLLITGVGKDTSLKDIEYINHELPIKFITNLEEKITLGHCATNTKENAKETEEWLSKNKFKTIILVTSNYHIPRSVFEFKLALPSVNIIKNPVFQNNSLNNYLGRLYYLYFTEYNKYILVILSNILQNYNKFFSGKL